MQFPTAVYNKEQFSCLLHHKLLHLSVTHLAVQHKGTAWIKNAFVCGADRDLKLSHHERFCFSFLWLPLASIIVPNLLRLRKN